MSNETLYNKYRPKLFAEVVGQKKIVASLTSYLKKGKGLPHAIMFCGLQGTGKTTLARLVSKFLNCEKPNGFEPCNQCSNCKAALEGHHPDLIEMDAASERGIDDIRDLKALARTMPSVGKVKAMIIDEVHDLTSQAMDAILKMLEEPPENLYFFFCTTNPQKVSKTIQSRCTIFRLWWVSQTEIAARLREICQAEHIEFVDDALYEIARIANGSMRDAISILQAVQPVGVSLENIYNYSDAVSPVKVFDLLECAVQHKLKIYLAGVSDLIQQSNSVYGVLWEVLNTLWSVQEVRMGLQREKLIPSYQLEKYKSFAAAFGSNLDVAITEVGLQFPVYDELKAKVLLLTLYQRLTGTQSERLQSPVLPMQVAGLPVATAIDPSKLRNYSYWFLKRVGEGASVLTDSADRVSIKYNEIVIDCVCSKDKAVNSHCVLLEDLIKLFNSKESFSVLELIQKGVIWKL
ncbi:DNA polymerase III subunit gamma/tau [candidate division WWE3 bacterium]|uniref:DNA polymerase III subunit gamma/tau n=1 Tax=candidate division WWE3 bacterium TaxID=2053526 RepID=A0A3A4ZF50_UNCKA|nr:MAG: DNA polymerase III subunit gamma/tau [candidate division WWE3 bacterium]